MRASALPWRSVLLTLIFMVSASAWAEPFGYSINSRGDFSDNSRVFALWRVNLVNGDAEYIGWTGRGDFIDIEGMAFSPDGRLFGADDNTNTLVRIGTSSGNAIAVGGRENNTGIPLGTSMDFGMTFTCDGRLLVSSAGTGELFHADEESGLLERIGDLGLPLVDLAVVGDQVYGLGLGTDRDGTTAVPNLYRVDAETASAELIGALGSAASPYNQAGLAADEDGQLWAITDRNRVFGDDDTEARPSEILRIDPETGRATRAAETIVGIESLAIGPPSQCDGDGGRDVGMESDEVHAIPLMSDAGRWLLLLLLVLPAAWHLRRTQS
ncbi:hypothetical protein IC757_15065 [Wenzhouxiangella sp. AB-CW3]|uniref:hypothetical protein n=1 Tax=Wenzhouxiangella sp. AB-CW3 TaxID=2771012 RepID=UPI00168B9697|nr:hypothetical protein [Wenzhouxiangella sp. AB-CW3]QOC22318.1 hypothetical protein IC757_15065 [Wenzhouxiangella sp. AB-CW3]